MSFAITGFAGEQLRVRPQPFQALSLGGQAPVPPAPAYGTPNANLVPVSRPPAATANLTLAAEPTFAAILNLGAVALARPGIAAPANSTSGVSALNPGVEHQQLGPVGGTPVASAPQGPVSFTLTGPSASTPTISEPPPATPAPTPAPAIVTSAPSLPPSRSPQYVLPSNPGLVARITATVHQIAVNAVYPAPIFSFSA